MLTRHITWLFSALLLAGCDRIPGLDQKTQDAEAIGYACRVSKKVPQDCIKDNEAQSPAAILAGWKNADQDIQNRLLDPSMSGQPLIVPQVKKKAEKSAENGENPEATKTDKPEKTDKAEH